jgi:hypothetical protein
LNMVVILELQFKLLQKNDWIEIMFPILGLFLILWEIP